MVAADPVFRMVSVYRMCTPPLCFFVTIFVCSPWYVPSRVKSRHHWIIVIRVIIVPIPSKLLSYWWNHLISPIKVTIAPMAPVSGHGLLFTMWNGWFSCIDISLLL